MNFKGSIIASAIDNEYQKKKNYEEDQKRQYEDFKDRYCRKCLNSETDMCEIRRNQKNRLSCIYYEAAE